MPLITGFALALLAGVTMGLSGWSMKLVRVWKWENSWLVYAIISLIMAPTALAYLLLPHLNQVYASLTPHEMLLLLLSACFGASLSWAPASLYIGSALLYRVRFSTESALLWGP